MTTFIDASVFVAILGDEPDAYEQVARIQGSVDPCTSPLAVWEAAISLSRRRICPVRQAWQDVEEMMQVGGIRYVSIAEREGSLAIEAFEAYGKGTGHPAQLNMGDCFAYACAKAHDARLLYKGNDFMHTDLADA